MSKTNELWREEVEKICAQYAAGELTRDEAITILARKGIDNLDARTMLDASAP